MQIAAVILGILIVGALVGSALNFASVFLGIPFALIAIGIIVSREQMSRQKRIFQMKRFRNSAKARKVEFTETDKRTVI